METLKKYVDLYLWGGTMTDEVIHLLTERNRYLSQFSTLNRIQLDRAEKGNFDQINEFYSAREHLLAIIEKIEIIINEKSKTANSNVSESVRKNIEALLNNKDQLIRDILDQDLKMMSLVEAEKTLIVSQLNGLAKGRKTINAYKSGLFSSKVDEEA